jgi:hypothetical protein
MVKQNVTVHWLGRLTSTVVPIDAMGIGTFEVPKGTSEFMLMGGPKVVEEPYRIAYINCNDAAGKTIQVAQVIEKGIVPANTCGHAMIPSRPGEVVFWALPKPWWQPDFQ